MPTGSSSPNRPAAILTLWERGMAVSPSHRADALLDAPVASLGARNAALLSLRSRLLGRTQALRCTCVHCGGTNEFSVDCDALAHSLIPPVGVDGAHALKSAGYVVEFRAPTSLMLREAKDFASATTNEASFTNALLSGCVVRCVNVDGEECDVSDLPSETHDAIGLALERIEPGASIEFDVVCAECGGQWSAPMDCAEVVWSEIQSRAERLLLDVDVLARAYGWREDDVLALSDTRRAAYLQLASALCRPRHAFSRDSRRLLQSSPEPCAPRCSHVSQGGKRRPRRSSRRSRSRCPAAGWQRGA